MTAAIRLFSCGALATMLTFMLSFNTTDKMPVWGPAAVWVGFFGCLIGLTVRRPHK